MQRGGNEEEEGRLAKRRAGCSQLHTTHTWEMAKPHLTIISCDSAVRVKILSAVRRSKLNCVASGTTEAVISTTSSSRTAPAGVSDVISR